jgi:hypothetical protein
MSPRELILLSPYRFPAQNALMIAGEDVAAFLNGYAALWHPAALQGATAPPRITSPYDYEQPVPGHVYAVPESPPPLLPDDWDQRVREVGAVAFRATADRAATLANLKDALAPEVLPADPRSSLLDPRFLLDLGPDTIGPFIGIGFGQRMVETLFEAMEHEQVLSAADFWLDVQAAVAALANPDPEAWRRHLRAAAERLQAAREVVYPVTVHLLDLWLPDEERPAATVPASFERGLPLNVIACAALLERLGRDSPELLAALRERVGRDEAEVCGGPYQEREDALLPVESQLWNLRTGLEAYRRLLDQEVRVFARKRFAAHPQLPLLLNHVGLRRALLVAFDESVLPSYRVTVVNWPSPDGKQVEAFTRAPYRADDPLTFFHWAHYLHKTIAQDHGATLALLHTSTPAAPSYDDLLELSRMAPVLGQWTTLSRYFNDVLAGEYISAPPADEFHGDYLSERTAARRERPVSWFARHLRLRRRFDTARTLAALLRGLGGTGDAAWDQRLAAVEGTVEGGEEEGSAELAELEREATEALAERLVARSAGDSPGFLFLNPCSFTRRVAVELEGLPGPLAVTGPLKALQLDGDKARLVVEVPALGFAWVPRQGPPGTPPPVSRMRLADASHVRNEFFEAEIDPATGGLRGLRDPRTRINRIGQQLVFNPGSTMRAKEVRVTSAGPALGEVISEGALLDEQGQVLALFRQRFRAWLGRPMLELRIELYPEHLPQGYPWHAYYGARFAWRDERATLLRGVNGAGYLTSHTRPETPDYLEVRLGRQSTMLFPGGLPFHQRHGGRMLDVVLIPEGETARAFDLGLGLDREYPMQTALGVVTPVAVVPTAKGPPPVGSAGWLFHLDAPNLLLTSLWPAADGADAVFARLLECNQYAGQAELRCPRDPRRAEVLDEQGNIVTAASTAGDAVLFETPPGDLLRLRIDFDG